jgi:hypothetical protein
MPGGIKGPQWGKIMCPFLIKRMLGVEIRERANRRRKMYKYWVNLGIFLLVVFVVFFVWGHVSFEEAEYSGEAFTSTCFGQSNSEEPKNTEGKDIQWFRDEMNISPKYMERQEGILGMSWTHFFTMLFLVFFFIGAIVALVLRHRRAKQLLNQLFKEERRGADG